MKTFIPVFLILLSLLTPIFVYRENVTAYYNRLVNFSFCEEPIKYSTGSIDNRFDISPAQLTAYSKKAEFMWEKATQMDLFQYDPQADLTINLEYDVRQPLIQKISTQELELLSVKEELEVRIAEFENKKDKINSEISSLNDEIDYWNDRGGAPEDVYEDLVSRQRELQSEADVINKQAEDLTSQINEINSQVDELSNTVDQFNSILSVKPEEGLYMPGENRIEVYFYKDEQQLVNTIAHELGHALGLEHSGSPESLMFPVSSESISLTSLDVQDVEYFCREQNRLTLFKNDLKYLIYTLASNFQN